MRPDILASYILFKIKAQHLNNSYKIIQTNNSNKGKLNTKERSFIFHCPNMHPTPEITMANSFGIFSKPLFLLSITLT